MAVGDYEEILKYYELRETIGTGRINLRMPTDLRLTASVFV